MSGIFKKVMAGGVSAAMLVGTLAGPVAADDDDDERRERKYQPVLVKDQSATIMAGTTSWVNVLWVANGDIDDFSITAEGKDGTTIGYSETTGDHAGPMNGYALADFESDFTALQIAVPEDFKKKHVKVEIEAVWTGPDGEREDKTFKLRVPVVHHDGKDWQLVDDQATLGTGWVEVPVVGLAPSSDDLQFRLDDRPVEVYLPQGDWTGPHHDSALDAGETDVLRFYIEPGAMSDDQPFTFTATWSRNGHEKSESVPFTVLAS